MFLLSEVHLYGSQDMASTLSNLHSGGNPVFETKKNPVLEENGCNDAGMDS
jgi:hypothetical protein